MRKVQKAYKKFVIKRHNKNEESFPILLRGKSHFAYRWKNGVYVMPIGCKQQQGHSVAFLMIFKRIHSYA